MCCFGSSSQTHPGALVLTADTFFAALFVSGIVASVINLIPLDFLPGAAIARWSRAVWAALFALAVFLLVEVMLLPAARDTRLGNASFLVTIILFVAFGAVSVAFHQYFANRHRRTGRSGDQTDAKDVEEENTILTSPTVRPGPGVVGRGCHSPLPSVW
jgi:heme/copper-type cytochrome/quinol oxidase subunit 2